MLSLPPKLAFPVLSILSWYSQTSYKSISSFEMIERSFVNAILIPMKNIMLTYQFLQM